MAASTQVMGQPTPDQMARGIAGAVPSELSHSPVIGILGVIMGAGIVTLAGRMLTLGLGDLKGSLGIGFDSGAWIASSFNIALMFIGPFTVFIGGLIGPRRILLACAAAFTIIFTLLPFVHSYSLLITGLVLAGLTSGTFYPLTLTFALRNIPIRFLPFTLALYATFVDMSVNIAPSLYGWCRDELTWRWMFWIVALMTPFMMACIYFGIPKTPAPKRSGPAPSFAGFLYGSAGLAMLFAAIDQGQRLDWWRSGLFTGLFLGGTFLFTFAFVRRLLGPNPLVDLPFLGKRNTLLGAGALMFFRFGLLATIILVPQTLSIHGFEADQIGPAVIWTAIPQLPLAFLAGLLLLRNLDSRFLMAIGFTCIAFASLINANLTSAWSAQNFYRTELLMGVGQSFAFLGLVSTLVLQGVFSGGLLKPQWILSFSAFMHTIRLFGGEVGVSFMTHFIAEREKLHSNLLGLHVQQGNWISNDSIRGITAGLLSKSSGLLAASGRAVGVIAGRLRLQAYTLSIIDGFHLIAWACVCALILICFIRRSPYRYGELSAIQQAAIRARNGAHGTAHETD
jgi:MFS transporter, DHA2 family, multidrug resistance protein